MRRLTARAPAAALTAAACAAALLTAAEPAAAAGYNGVCGSGYGVVNKADVGGAGTVYLTYNNSNGRNCAVSVRSSPGAKMAMDVQLAPAGNPDAAKLDSGDFGQYAGPVYLEAAGTCVTWSAIIGDAAGGKAGTNCG
ncbi:spore-associated protein A [Nocardiopsis coralliicola]